MQMPATMRAALEREAARFRLSELERAHERISAGYRSGRPPQRLSEVERAAYSLARMPATYGACHAVLREVARLQQSAPDAPAASSLLDLGAGLGALLWAAAECLPTISAATLIDADSGMTGLGRALAAQAESELVRQATWRQGEISSMSLPPSDVVTCSYSLGELDPAAGARALLAAWTAVRQTLIIIEPGTPAGFARIRGWRDQLLALGAHLLAPCPHENRCPLPDSDWCHFAQRVERTALHRKLKGGALGYEDEKFAYIAVSRIPARRAASRVLRHPQISPGAITLRLCGSEGLQELRITRRQPEAFRHARHIRWGDAWE
jgi:ribosomal protein RSM22 (predicted rRNA methylase)